MAQLTDDCFAFFGPLITVDEVERLIASRVEAVTDIEIVDLSCADGRVTASNVLANTDLPIFDNSAVDGYAVRYVDLKPADDTRLAPIGRTMAGRTSRPIAAGEAIRIFTGAPMPKGADTVFMQEDVREENGFVVLPPGQKAGANRRFAGEDLIAGAIALPAGRRLTPPHIALAAGLGINLLQVRRRVRVALFSTGDEIVEPGAPRPNAAIYDANRRFLAALLARYGAEVTDLGILPDEPETLKCAMSAAAARHDLVLTSGGVSMGDADFVRRAVEKIGKLVFWRVAIKPGRPVAMGVIDGAAFVGLPGNPVAVFITFMRVARPLLLRLAGALPEPLAAMPVRAGFAYAKKKGRREYVRVSLRPGRDGSIEAQKHPKDGAGIITSLTETDGLAELAEEQTSLEPGATVGFIPYTAMMG